MSERGQEHDVAEEAFYSWATWGKHRGSAMPITHAAMREKSVQRVPDRRTEYPAKASSVIL